MLSAVRRDVFEIAWCWPHRPVHWDPLSTILLRFRHISALCTSHRDHRASLLVFPSFTRTTYRSAIPNTHNSPTSTRITLAPPAFQHLCRCHKKGEVSIAVGCSLHQNPMVYVYNFIIRIYCNDCPHWNCNSQILYNPNIWFHGASIINAKASENFLRRFLGRIQGT